MVVPAENVLDHVALLVRVALGPRPAFRPLLLWCGWRVRGAGSWSGVGYFPQLLPPAGITSNRTWKTFGAVLVHGSSPLATRTAREIGSSCRFIIGIWGSCFQ